MTSEHAQGWRARWAQAKAAAAAGHPGELTALRAELAHSKVAAEARELEELRRVRAQVEARRCERCQGPIPSLSRRVCPPCTQGGSP